MGKCDTMLYMTDINNAQDGAEEQKDAPMVCDKCGNEACTCGSDESSEESPVVDEEVAPVAVADSMPEIEDPADANVCESCQ